MNYLKNYLLLFYFFKNITKEYLFFIINQHILLTNSSIDLLVSLNHLMPILIIIFTMVYH